MARMPGSMYRQIKGQAYTRREYSGGVPNNRILRYFMGDRKAAEAGQFDIIVELSADNACPVRASALESARHVANAALRTLAGDMGYALRIPPYPHHTPAKSNISQNPPEVLRGY